jgi:hypothetical protein
MDGVFTTIERAALPEPVIYPDFADTLRSCPNRVMDLPAALNCVVPCER